MEKAKILFMYIAPLYATFHLPIQWISLSLHHSEVFDFLPLGPSQEMKNLIIVLADYNYQCLIYNYFSSCPLSMFSL